MQEFFDSMGHTVQRKPNLKISGFMICGAAWPRGIDKQARKAMNVKKQRGGKSRQKIALANIERAEFGQDNEKKPAMFLSRQKHERV